MMFNLSDRVQHKLTGDVGVVVGYGHRIVDRNYVITLKVRLIRANSIKLMVEDLFSKWRFFQEDDERLFRKDLEDYYSVA
ncbi:MAG: hypothetical protein Tsb0014_19870 [Pleurocapsa sp.]